MIPGRQITMFIFSGIPRLGLMPCGIIRFTVMPTNNLNALVVLIYSVLKQPHQGDHPYIGSISTPATTNAAHCRIPLRRCSIIRALFHAQHCH